MNGQPRQTFAEFAANGSVGDWIFGRRDGSASTTTPAKENPTPPAALDPEPPRITSDILPPQPPTQSPAVQFAPPPQEDAGPRSTKYQTDAERRKAISEALKRRRASGPNDQSYGQQKRVQTGSFQPSLSSFPPQLGPSAPHQPRPFEPASTSTTSVSSSTSESSDVEMMEHSAPLLAENIPDDSDDGDWEEGTQGSDASVANLLDSQLQAETSEAADTVPRALELTPSGRSYLRWKDESMYGTIIPDGYEWSSARSGFPCLPQRQHRGTLFHDNMDGTLSICGHYAKLRDGGDMPSDGRPKPGIVISVGPPDPLEAPMVAPSLPDSNQPHLANGSEDGALPTSTSSLVKVSSETLAGSPVTGDPVALWKSLQPYLSKFKGAVPPSKGHVKALLSLPKLRDFDWNYPRIQTHPFMDTSPRDISSLILQVTGEPAPTPCHRCASGKGLFHSCVMISPQAPKDIIRNVVGCANCFYHFNQTYCTLKDWGTERARKLLYNGKSPNWEYGNSEWDAEPTMFDVTEHVDSSLMDGDAQTTSAPAVSAIGKALLSTPSVSDGFELAERGRKYTEWSDGSAAPQSLCGALIPAGYTMRSVPRRKPFPCPVRRCEMECIRTKDLGFHFVRGHYASYLKDNGDGTFDVVGVYAPKRGNLIKSGKILTPGPPIVVAQTRPDGSIKWVPNWENMKRLSAQDAAAAAIPDPPSDVPISEETPVTNVSDPTPGVPQGSNGPPKATWDLMEAEPTLSQAAQDFWLNKVLPALSGPTDIPRNPAVIELLECSQRRELRPGLNLGGKQPLAVKMRDIAAIILQMVGDQVPESNVCTRCQHERGLWRECIIVPQTASLETRKHWTSCANCTLRGGASNCSLKGKFAPGTAVQQLRDWPTSTKKDTPTGDGKMGVWEQGPRDYVETVYVYKAPGTGIGRVEEKEDDDTEDLEEREGPSTRYQMRTRTAVSTIVQEQQQRSVVERRQPPNGVMSKGGASVATGLVTTESVLEMEDWEVAPGRIREQDPNSEAIAFSKSYLSSAYAVDVCEDVAFRVDTIQSGHNLKIEADSNQLRLCSLASGKLRVKIGDEPEFVIGPHGMFKVKAGVSCTVTNRMYIDAIMHTTVLNGFV
ncbi:hypothetical protein B0T21DRAFT_345056 [Apiosordaria backusii]|uniref:Uncharacterized protein n=1 Tax=Apiosordaria backusii TaxID=314023 RepID=A0AA40ET20_9PEZI|nr:hypothetical protein B0T21DRAFT_345056 [Apiosordaria backusii]